jgi:hypothetical protein
MHALSSKILVKIKTRHMVCNMHALSSNNVKNGCLNDELDISEIMYVNTLLHWLACSHRVRLFMGSRSGQVTKDYRIGICYLFAGSESR